MAGPKSMVDGQPVTAATAPSPEKKMDDSVAPQVAPGVVIFDVAVTKVVLEGVKPAVAVHVAPAFKVTSVCVVTATCPASGPSSESEKGEPGALNVNVPGAFPMFDNVSV
jgi:hypothetical protein